MATVYLGQHRSTGAVHALKHLHPHLASIPAIKEQFCNEAKLLDSLEHPVIPRYFGKVEDEGRLAIVMEWSTGTNLDELHEKGSLSDRSKLHHMAQAATALAYAHARGIVHRDVKPENILISGDETKLADFGLSLIDQNKTQSCTPQSPQGTPYFMAPEQWRVEKLNGAADMYSVGVSLYYLLTNTFPFEGNSALDIRAKQAFGTKVSAKTRHPLLCTQLDELITSLLHSEARFRPSAKEVVRALNPSLVRRRKLPKPSKNRTQYLLSR